MKMETTKDFKTIDMSVEDDVCTIVLGTGENMNPFEEGLLEELEVAITAAGKTDDIRVVVLEGSGGQFSSGGGSEKMKKRLEKPSETWRDKLLYKWGHKRAIINCPKPVIAKIEGVAVGGGATLATVCDITVASTDARIGELHINMGYSAPDTPALWPLLIGVNKTKELVMTGELLNGEEAEELGLVNYAVPPEELDEKVDELVDTLASGPQYAIYYSKLMTNKWLKWALLTIADEGHAHMALTEHLPDHEHALNAFMNDEKPNFPSGRGE